MRIKRNSAAYKLCKELVCLKDQGGSLACAPGNTDSIAGAKDAGKPVHWWEMSAVVGTIREIEER